MSGDFRKAAVVFLAAVFVRWLFHLLTGFLLDDAFITFRYAENLAAGHGFVYNIGQKVLGTTTPLFTFILALLAYIRIPTIEGALLVSFVSSGLIAVVLYRLARALDFGSLSYVPVVLYMFFPRLLATDTSGMETSFFTLLITVAFYLQFRRKPIHAMVVAALASVTRPEGYLLLGILFVHTGFRYSRRVVAGTVVAASLVLPWIVFAYCYFGSPVPSSVLGKIAVYSRLATRSPWESMVFMLAWYHPLGVALSVLVAVGGWWLLKQRHYGWCEMAWMVVVLGLLAVSPTHIFSWYIAPVYPFYLLFAGAAVPAIWERFEWFRRREGILVKVVLVVMVAVMLPASIRTVKTLQSGQEYNQKVYRAIGQYLQGHAAATDIVAAEDIGYLGYYSGLNIIDRDGLVTPEAIEYNRNGDYLGLILDYRPDWVVAWPGGSISGFVDSSAFAGVYQPRKRFGSTLGREFQVFSRKRGL